MAIETWRVSVTVVEKLCYPMATCILVGIVKVYAMAMVHTFLELQARDTKASGVETPNMDVVVSFIPTALDTKVIDGC